MSLRENFCYNEEWNIQFILEMPGKSTYRIGSGASLNKDFGGGE